MTEICCIGHLTLDKVITPSSELHMPGGTSFYFSNAIRTMKVSYRLVTAVGVPEYPIIEELRAKGIEVMSLPSKHTVCFENIYNENQDHRTQRVTQKADPFTVDALVTTDARFYHLGPLLADDIPLELLKELSKKGTVSLDIQGYLREVRNQHVHPIDWLEKQEALKYITILKANEAELEVLTGGMTDPYKGALLLAEMGVKEVVITLGSHGSLIYTNGRFFEIPAYKPLAIVDATGCGDTYMAGYLYRRAKGADFIDAGKFGAAMATIKIASFGPFDGSEEDVEALLSSNVD